MNSLIRTWCVFAFVVAVIGAGSNLVAEETAAYNTPDDVAYRAASIISEGTRMSAELFAPKGAEQKLPTIVMSHGWGGTQCRSGIESNKEAK